MVIYILALTLFIIACASVVPLCQYCYHKNQAKTIRYYFSEDLFERHLKTPANAELELKIQQESNLPLP